MSSSAIQRDAARLIGDQRWAALATLEDGAPLASMVAYATTPNLDALLLFLSQLAAHTRNLLEGPRVSLAVSAPDTGDGDPQLLPRVTLRGRARPIERDAEGFAEAAARYTQRFPDALLRFELADFVLFRFEIEEARYVGGFARASSFTGDEVRAAAADLSEQTA